MTLMQRREVSMMSTVRAPVPGGPLNYTAVHTRDHRIFEPTLSKFYPLVKFIPYSSIFACFFDNFAP